MEVKSTEQWQPGKADITKLTQQFFPYLKATGLDPPPQNELSLSDVDTSPTPMAESVDRWARQLNHRKAPKTVRQLKANGIEHAITQAMLDSGASKTFVNS